MNKNLYTYAVTEAAKYTDKNTFVYESPISLRWDEKWDGLSRKTDSFAWFEWLGDIWDAVHRDVPAIREAAGMTRTQFRAHFPFLSYRTAQSWDLRERTTPKWALLMIQEILGLVRREP